jgi:predicted dehydrogenase
MSMNTRDLRVVIHGCGGRSAGFWIPRLLKQPGVCIVGLCDYNVQLCRDLLTTRFGEVEPKPRIFEDPRQMYEQLAPDAAVIVTAHALHDEHCELALDAGCHISVEKPMATTLDRALALGQRVQAAGKVFQVAFNFPYSERSHGLRQAIEGGRFGPVQALHASISQPWRSMHRGTWRMDPSLSGGGFLHDTGTHLLQAVLYLHTAQPVQVSAQIDCLDCPVDINAAVQIRFDDDTAANLTFCGNSPSRCIVQVAGESGGVQFTSLHGHDATAWDAQGQEIALPAFDKSIRHEHNFLAAIHDGQPVRSGWRDGVRVCELVEAAYASAQLGRPVDLAPARAAASGVGR